MFLRWSNLICSPDRVLNGTKPFLVCMRSPNRACRILKIVENCWSHYNTRLQIWFTSPRLNLSVDRLHKDNSYIFYHLHITESEYPNISAIYLILRSSYTLSCFHSFSVLLLLVFLDYNVNLTIKAEYVLLTCTTYISMYHNICVCIYMYRCI